MAIVQSNKVFKNSVFFRFASEGNALEKVEFYGREIAVGDLKAAIAEQKHLPKFDLVLVNEATGEVYEKEGKMLPRNMSVTVRRTPVYNSKKPAVVHVEGKDIWTKLLQEGSAEPRKEEPKAPIVRRACPPEYLCGLCGRIFASPKIARCCGRSACEACFARHTGRCPLCARDWSEETTPIPNPRLAESVESLNLDYFIVPGREEEEEEEEASACKAEGEAAAAAEARLPGHALPVGVGAGAGDVPAAASSAVPRPPGGWAPGLRPPPPGVAVRPCMLSPEQFYMWQQSLKRGRDNSESGTSSGARRRKKEKKAKKRKEQGGEEKGKKEKEKAKKHAKRA